MKCIGNFQKGYRRITEANGDERKMSEIQLTTIRFFRMYIFWVISENQELIRSIEDERINGFID